VSDHFAACSGRTSSRRLKSSELESSELKSSELNRACWARRAAGL